MGQPAPSPSVQNFVTPAPVSSPMPGNYFPPPVTPTPRTNTGVVVGLSIAGVIVVALAGFSILGGASGPSMDVESPRALLMDSRDFTFDMVADSDALDFTESGYRFFGEDCGANNRVIALLGKARTRAEVAYTSGDSLYQYINFDQALLEMPTADDATDFVEQIRSGSMSSSCESDYESISTRYYGDTTLEAFGYDIENSVVYYGETIYDSSVLEATLREVFVVVAQDEYVLALQGSLDASTSYVSFGEMERAVQDAVDKAYGESD
jgi:hypothetical protein